MPKPYRDIVCIKTCKHEERTYNGIIIPTVEENAPRKGVVISVGEGSVERHMEVRPGQVVWYGRYSGVDGIEVEIDCEEYIMISENNIYAVENPESDIPVPLRDMVVIQPEEHVNEVTKGGIIIQGKENLTRYGKVMAVGKGGLSKPMQVKVGDVAVYTKFRTANGVEVFAGKNKYVICREKEIYAVL